MTSLACDIVILPSSALAGKAIRLSQQLQSYGGLFTLQDGVCFPHTSLYMTQLKETDIEKAKELLADIAANTSALNLTAVSYGQAEAFLDADYQRFDALDELQMRVIEAINPIRDGMRPKDQARLLTASGTVRDNLEKYGYRSVGELFRPHMSLTRFASSNEIKIDDLPVPSELSGAFTKLGLFEMGDNGTCIRQLASFNFAY